MIMKNFLLFLLQIIFLFRRIESTSFCYTETWDIWPIEVENDAVVYYNETIYIIQDDTIYFAKFENENDKLQWKNISNDVPYRFKMNCKQWTQIDNILYILPWPLGISNVYLFKFNVLTLSWQSNETYNYNVPIMNVDELTSSQTSLCNNGTHIFMVIYGYIISYDVANDYYINLRQQLLDMNLGGTSCSIILNTQIMYIFGGQTNTYSDGIWQYDIMNNILNKIDNIKLKNPSNAIRSIVLNDKIYLYDGFKYVQQSGYNNIDGFYPQIFDTKSRNILNWNLDKTFNGDRANNTYKSTLSSAFIYNEQEIVILYKWSIYKKIKTTTTATSYIEFTSSVSILFNLANSLKITYDRYYCHDVDGNLSLDSSNDTFIFYSTDLNIDSFVKIVNEDCYICDYNGAHCDSYCIEGIPLNLRVNSIYLQKEYEILIEHVYINQTQTECNDIDVISPIINCHDRLSNIVTPIYVYEDAIAYYNNTLYVLDGFDGKLHYTQFKDSSFIKPDDWNHIEFNTSNGFLMVSQQWTQIDNMLFLISDTHFIYKINLSTLWLRKYVIPNAVEYIIYDLCLCNNGTHLFLVGNGKIIIYNIDLNQYILTSPKKEYVNEEGGSACIVTNEYMMYIFGGITNGNLVWQYNILSDEISIIDAKSKQFSNHVRTLTLPDGNIYIYGSHNIYSQIFDINTKQFKNILINDFGRGAAAFFHDNLNGIIVFREYNIYFLPTPTKSISSSTSSIMMDFSSTSTSLLPGNRMQIEYEINALCHEMNNNHIYIDRFSFSAPESSELTINNVIKMTYSRDNELCYICDFKGENCDIQCNVGILPQFDIINQNDLENGQTYSVFIESYTNNMILLSQNIDITGRSAQIKSCYQALYDGSNPLNIQGNIVVYFNHTIYIFDNQEPKIYFTQHIFSKISNTSGLSSSDWNNMTLNTSSFSFAMYGQQWTQIDNILYIIPFTWNNVYFITFDLSLFELNYISEISLYKNDTFGYGSCLANNITNVFIIGNGEIIMYNIDKNTFNASTAISRNNIFKQILMI